MAHLITSSLLDSFDWLQHCPASWKAKANEEFLGTIRRTKTWEPSPEAQRGMDFEDFICKNCNVKTREEFEDYSRKGFAHLLDKDNSVSDSDKLIYAQRCVVTAMVFYDLCKAGQQQVKVQRELDVFGEKYLVFGYADIVHPNKILDIKTTTKYRGDSKYLKRAQHHAYCYALGVPEFVYVVADYRGTKYPLDWHTVPVRSDEEQAQSTLKGRIHNMVSYLKQYDLFDDYVQLFSKGK